MFLGFLRLFKAFPLHTTLAMFIVGKLVPCRRMDRSGLGEIKRQTYKVLEKIARTKRLPKFNPANNREITM